MRRMIESESLGVTLFVCDNYVTVWCYKMSLRSLSLVTRNCLLRYDLDTFNILCRRSLKLISKTFSNSVSTLWTRLVKVNPDSPCAWVQACNVGWVHNLLFVCCWPYLDRTRKTRSWRFGRPFDFSRPLFNRLRHLMRILYVNEQMMRFCRVYIMIGRIHTAFKLV